MEKGILAERIRKVFESHPPPNSPKKINYDSEEWEETHDLWAKTWDELDVEIFESHMNCFIFLRNKNFVNFFGAFMYHSLLSEVFDITALDLLTYSAPDDKLPYRDQDLDAIGDDWINELRNLLSFEQVALIEDYFKVRGSFIGEECNDYGMKFVKSLKRKT